MNSNYNQNTNWLNLKKIVVLRDVEGNFNSFTLSNFKLYKLYFFLIKSLCVCKKNKSNLNNLINKNKLYYNLKFDCYRGLKHREFIVRTNKTKEFSKLRVLQFDDNLIKEVYNDF